YKPAKRKKVEEYLKVQGRFRHLTQQQIDEIQDEIDKEWRELEKVNVSAVTI
ncbi:MAG: pyruvate ferredoxin oxidoreductase, partial [Candidatus Altiarchaeales archaeon HGW-Altiarchaeales-2]